MTIRCPNGHTDKFERGGTIATLMYVHTYVDGAGNAVTNDPNTYTTFYRCLTCGADFCVVKQGGKTAIRPPIRIGQYVEPPTDAENELATAHTSGGSR